MAPIKEWFGLYNVMFNWFEEKYGKLALEEYWRFIAERCFSDVSEEFKNKGLEGIRDYFQHTFDKDDGEYRTTLDKDTLTFEVVKCPDYEFMRSSENPHFKPINSYCKHHETINSILSEKAGYSFCMSECNNLGQCKWVFKKL